MALATYQMLVDWGKDGTLGNGTGEDVTARTLSADWSRGRDFASQLTGRASAGRFSAVLNNESGDYSSFNTASPLYGSLLPGRLVQLTGTVSGTSYTLWTGYLQRVTVAPSVDGLNTASLEAIGPMGYLNQYDVAVPMLTSVTTGSAIGTILDKAGWGTARAIDTGETTMARFWTDRVKTVMALRKVEDTEAGFILESKTGSLVFESRHHRLKAPHYTSQGTFTDAGAGTLFYGGVQQEDPLPQIFNEIEAKVQLFTVGSLGTLWSLAETGTASPLVGRNGGERIYWAGYPNPDSPTDAISVDAWTTPASGTDFNINTYQDGSGVNINADMAVAVTKFGNAMKITLTNNNATADGYVTLLQARGTPITRSDPVKVTRDDGTSQTAYGQRTYPTPAEFIPDTVEAEDWCRYHLGIYKDPRPILAVSIPANRDNTHLTQVMLRDVSDRVTVVGTGNAGLGISRDFFIEAEHHRIDRDRTHTVTWELSDAVGYSDFWVLDISALGTTTRLAY